MKNIFTKNLVSMKNVCIFALAFERESVQKTAAFV